MIFAFLKFLFSRTTKNGRVLRKEIMKQMPKKEKAHAAGD